jgi:hypothetical protein
MSKAHNPTPEERDERFSLYGLDPEKVGEAVLNTPPEPTEPEAKPKRRRSG